MRRFTASGAAVRGAALASSGPELTQHQVLRQERLRGEEVQVVGTGAERHERLAAQLGLHLLTGEHRRLGCRPHGRRYDPVGADVGALPAPRAHRVLGQAEGQERDPLEGQLADADGDAPCTPLEVQVRGRLRVEHANRHLARPDRVEARRAVGELDLAGASRPRELQALGQSGGDLGADAHANPGHRPATEPRHPQSSVHLPRRGGPRRRGVAVDRRECSGAGGCHPGCRPWLRTAARAARSRPGRRLPEGGPRAARASPARCRQ